MTYKKNTFLKTTNVKCNFLFKKKIKVLKALESYSLDTVDIMLARVHTVHMCRVRGGAEGERNDGVTG